MLGYLSLCNQYNAFIKPFEPLKSIKIILQLDKRQKLSNTKE